MSAFDAGCCCEMNIENILKEIEKDFSEERVDEMFAEEVFSGNWVDVDWKEDGYENEYDWYCDHGRGEAESVVVDEIVLGWEEKYNGGKVLSGDEKCEVVDGIRELYYNLGLR